MAGEISFGLQNPNAGVQAGTSLLSGQKMALDNQLAQEQVTGAQDVNALNRYKLNAQRRTDQTQQAIQGLMQNGFNPNNPAHIQQLMQFGPEGVAIAKSIGETQASAATVKAKGATTDKTVQEFLAQGKRDMAANPSDANVTAWTEDAVLKGYMTTEQAQQSLQHMLAMTPEQRKAYLMTQGATAGDLKAPVATPTELTKLQTEMATLPAGDPRRTDYANRIQMITTRAPAASTNVTVISGAQEKEFEKQLGTGQAKALLDSRSGAEDAAAMLGTIKTGREILKAGMITGAGANFFIGLDQALKKVEIDYGGDASSNSQAYVANMAQNVGKLIKQFGAGTGLSDADRAYAEKMAGGNVTMDEKAIRKILDINERAAKHVIATHNAKAKDIKTNIPLTVDVPAETPANNLSPAEQAELETLRKRFNK